jgi:glutamate-1-semialdehyde aminotransferase
MENDEGARKDNDQAGRVKVFRYADVHNLEELCEQGWNVAAFLYERANYDCYLMWRYEDSQD